MKKTAAGPAAVRHAFTVIPTKDPFLHALAFSQTRISLTHKIGKAKVRYSALRFITVMVCAPLGSLDVCSITA